MALTRLSGVGMRFPIPILGQSGGSQQISTVALMDAAAERIAFCGRVWWPDMATHSVRKIHFLTGAVSGTDDATNILRVSLQGVDVANGPPVRPDDGILGTGAAGFALLSFEGSVLNSSKDSTWITTGALGVDVSLAPGAAVAVDFAYTAWADASVVIGGLQAAVATGYSGVCCTSVYIGAPAWAASVCIPNVIFEDATGAVFGTLLGAVPCSGLVTVAYKSDTADGHLNNPPTGDEQALVFVPETTIKVSGAWVSAKVPAAADFNVVLYAGKTVLATVTVDANTVVVQNVTVGYDVTFSSEVTLTAGTTYYLSVLPTTTTANFYFAAISLSDAAHRACLSGGTAVGFAARDQGTDGDWSATLTTRVPLAGFVVSSIDDGASTGGGSLIGPGGLVT